MEIITSFQDLQMMGVLEKWSEEIRDRIIFVSHQWVGYDHPDPSKEQLNVLKNTLQRLMNGEVDVENNWKHQIIFKKKGKVSKE